jgi:hypothetical protein
MRCYKLGLMAFALVLGACASPAGTWMKNGATQLQVDQDSYTCLRQAQQPYGYSLGGYGWRGNGESFGVGTNQELYKACMRAQGYSWQPS